MGLALWLVPSAEQVVLIQSVLPQRPESSDHGLSPQSFPAIIPHITLASVPGGEAPDPNTLLSTVPANQVAVRAHFQSLEVDDHYFRSVLIDIERTQDMVDLQSRIMTNIGSLNLKSAAPRFPHMSLCYIRDEDASERKKAAEMLRETGVVSECGDRHGGSILLKCGDVRLSGFDGVEIWAVSCEGPVEEWKVERKILLALT
ncbi:hypothetical protein HYDPIDRAFT_123185 [Hydnomerulius pinastri MD-312]|nr:hypothetical protein HYDPIDRAFT_123185 [Hydnomerulius pinastri MD-312]